MDGTIGVGNGRILPAGPLRESLDSALKRVDAVVLIGAEDIQNIAPHIHKPVLHAQLRPDLPADFPHDAAFFAFAGIGRPEKFYQTCRDVGLNLIGTQDFPDHHAFAEMELLEIERKTLEQRAELLTTEKDWVRLSPAWQAKVKTLPVKLVFDIPELPRSYLK
jgi:tetraacyldisaccharide 4'-kinase